MLYCPGCKYEFQDKLVVCPDCGETLVAKLPRSFAPAVSPDDSWVLIGGVMGKATSKVAQGSLDSNNIPSVFVPSTISRGGDFTVHHASTTVQESQANLILVPKEFGDEARLVLRAVLGDELKQPDVDNPLI